MITCFSCETLSLSHLNVEKKLTCFFGYVNKIIAYSFRYDSKNENITIYSNKTISSNGAIILKTILYEAYSTEYWEYNSLVCFIDYFYGNSSCIIYNLINYETIKNHTLNNYLSISKNLFLEKTSYYYLIFCFYSSIEFTLIKLGLYYNYIEHKNYIINNDLIKNNFDYYYSILVCDKNANDIFILLNNDEQSFNLIKYKAEESNINTINNKPSILSNSLTYKIEKIISHIILGKKYYIIEDDYNITIYLANNKIDDNETGIIDLLNCEEKLRLANNLNENNTLTIVQVEIYSKNNKTLTNNVQFAIYDENKKKLNLSLCDGEKIRINYKMKKKEYYDIIIKVKDYMDFGVDLLDIESPFFNDICSNHIVEINDKFLNLEERIKLLYINYSICDFNCEYDKINIDNKTISCNCTSLIGIESNIEEPKFKQKAYKKQYLSLSIFECSWLFWLKRTYRNAGFWISIILLIIRLILYFQYFRHRINPIKNYIEKEMKKYHYDEEENTSTNNKRYIPQNRNNNGDLDSDRKIISGGVEIKNNDNIKENNNDVTVPNNEQENKRKKDIFIYQRPNNISDNIKINNQMKEPNITNENNEENIDNKNNERKIEGENDDQIVGENKKDENNENNNDGNKNDANNNNEDNNNNDINRNDDNNKDNINNDDKRNDNEFYTLITLDANNTSKNKIPKYSERVLDNYDYDLDKEYDKRSFCILFQIIMKNNDFINAFLFKSSLDLKPIKILIFVKIINDSLTFNALLGDFQYNGDKISLRILINAFLIPLLIAVLLSIIFKFINILADCKDDLREQFKEVEIIMFTNEDYKVKISTKIEIKMKICKILRCFEIKIIILFIIDILFCVFSSYYLIIYCNFFFNRQGNLIYQFFMTVIENISSNGFISLLLAALYKASIKYKKKRLYDFTLFVM